MPCVTCEEKIAWLQHLATVYGGTFYEEGYIRIPDIEELVAPVVEVFQAAMIYTVTANEVTTRYIITVGCGDDCPLGKRVLRDRESYIEKDGVCECPSLATFIENAEFGGYEVFGESLLVNISFNVGLTYSATKAKHCYIDNDGYWNCFSCTSCSTIKLNQNYKRIDYACERCIDYRQIIIDNMELLGCIEYQFGSHSCVSYTNNGNTKRIQVGIRSYGIIIDYRSFSCILARNGLRYVLSIAPTDEYDKKPDMNWLQVGNDASFSGYANLFSETRNDLGEIDENGNHVGIYGTALSVRVSQIAQYVLDATYEEALAVYNSMSSLGFDTARAISTTYRGGLSDEEWSLYNPENVFIENPTCDFLGIADGYLLPWSDGTYSAASKHKMGLCFSLRYIATNIGFLMPDGTYRSQIIHPFLEDVKACADEIRWEEAYSDQWVEGRVNVIESTHATDHTCEEIPPEEFE